MKRVNGREAARTIAAAVLVAATWAAAAEVPLSPRIVNGLPTSDFPTTGALLSGDGAATATTWCSGVMIGCDTFLTAAHCVCDFTGGQCQGAQAPDPSQYFVFLQHAGTVPVASIRVQPQFNFPTADVAVVKLVSPIEGIRPVPLNTTQDPGLGLPGTIVGFGRSGGSNYDYGLKRYGTIETAACPFGISSATSVCWRFQNPLGPPGTDSNTCNADSGGPLFMDFGQGDVVAGVTSGGTGSNCLPTDRSYDANVWFYRSWITGQAGFDLQHATCGASSQVGEPDTQSESVYGSVSALQPQSLSSFEIEPGTDRLVVAMNAEDDGSQNFDLYVKQGSPATPGDYDCRSAGQNQYEDCRFDGGVASGTWYVLVDRVSGAGDFQVTATGYVDALVDEVQVDLVSTTSQVTKGSTYPVTLNLANETGETRNFVLSLRLVLPDLTLFTLLPGTPLSVPDQATFGAPINLPIGGGFPTGNYAVVALVLDPSTFAVLDQDRAQFYVLP